MLTLDKNEESSIYSNFIDSIASKFTKSGYVNTLKNFMLFLKTDKYSDLTTMSQDRIFDSIKSYILHMKSTGLRSRTILIKLYALKCFYDMNDVEDIKWKKLKRFRGEDSDINEDRGYQHEEIQQILNVSDLRTKAVVLLLASSGIRVGALSTLKVGSIGSNLSITVYAKSQQKYTTFITPECNTAIQNYLNFRVRCGEKITPESPLFRTEFNIDFPEAARKKVDALSRAGHHGHLYLTLIKSGLREIDRVNPHARRPVMLAHGFRKFFRTQLVLSKVDSELRELLLGHSLKNLEHIYTRLTEAEIYQEYMKAVDNLTINPENRLRRKVEKLEVEKTQFDRLAAQIAALEDKIK